MPTNGLVCNYNAFLTNFSRLPISGAHDVMVTNGNGFNWQTNWFGNFYLPTNSPVFQRGSTNANLLGLYHFTTQTNQIPDGANKVDIGYHYVATDGEGNPSDTYIPGIPDYLVDANGDGLVDDGERNWALTLTITNPIINEVFIAGRTNIAIMATANDFEGTVTQVQFFSGNISLGILDSPPYNLVWSNVVAGNYGITAVAIDNYGLSVTSAVVNITIRPVIVQVTIGGERIMELTYSGDVSSWGGNEFGEFGDYTYLDSDAPLLQSNVPVHVAGLTNIVAIASGIGHSLALDANGVVWAWGINYEAQLGDGGLGFATNFPGQVIGMTNAIAIAAGGYFNEDGIFGISLAVKKDGTVWIWGGDEGYFQYTTPTEIEGISNAIKVAAADTYALILDTNGNVWMWSDGTLDEISGLSNIVDICSGNNPGGYSEDTYLAIDASGMVWTNGIVQCSLEFQT